MSYIVLLNFEFVDGTAIVLEQYLLTFYLGQRRYSDFKKRGFPLREDFFKTLECVAKPKI